MSRLLKSQNYLMNYLGFVLLLGFISLGAIGGCSNNNGGQDGTRALTENDFANDDNLRANLEKHTVVNFLEHPESEGHENDTGELGNDTVPLRYNRTAEHTYCWEDEDEEAGHFMELDDSEGNEIFRLDVNGECITVLLEAGDYSMHIHHDAQIERTHPVFIREVSEEDEQAVETKGLFNRLKVLASNILKGIKNTVSSDAVAQSVGDNINILITTNSCEFCNLSGVNFDIADLGGVNLRGAYLNGASFRGAYLGGADLRYVGTRLDRCKDNPGPDSAPYTCRYPRTESHTVNFQDAILAGAVMNAAYLPYANMIDANLEGASIGFSNFPPFNAVLNNADLRRAILRGVWAAGVMLQDARLQGADLTNASLANADLRRTNFYQANLTSVQFSNSSLGSATWCTGYTCAWGNPPRCEGVNPDSDDWFYLVCGKVGFNPEVDRCIRSACGYDPEGLGCTSWMGLKPSDCGVYPLFTNPYGELCTDGRLANPDLGNGIGDPEPPCTTCSSSYRYYQPSQFGQSRAGEGYVLLEAPCFTE